MASSKLKGDRPAPRPSLAATHPSNYAPPASKAMMPPPPPKISKAKLSTAEGAWAMGKKDTQKSHQPYPTPSPSPKEAALDYPQGESTRQPVLDLSEALTALKTPLRVKHRSMTVLSRDKVRAPWEKHTDPTLTASDAPVHWSRNHTVLKADTSIEHGNVISPTFMHGLPFGSMIEAAHHYPSEERLERL